jgi:hypothetical protein
MEGMGYQWGVFLGQQQTGVFASGPKTPNQIGSADMSASQTPFRQANNDASGHIVSLV